MPTVQEINDLADLAPYRAAWRSLLRKTPGATFFHTLEWLETYWSHFGGKARLRVLIVHHPTRVAGIVPLAVRRRRKFGSLRVLGYPLDNWGSFYGPIGPHPSDTLAAGLAHVLATRRDWDLVELDGIDLAGVDRGSTAAAFARAGLCGREEPRHASAMIDLTAHANWDAYWRSRTSHWRNNVRRSQKKLAERGTVRYVRYRPAGSAAGDDDPRWEWYEACEQIARASWQGASQTGTTLSHEQIRPFLRDCHQVAAAQGALDLNLLLVDEGPVAFNYAYHYRGSVFGLRTGYDASAASEGAGTVLQHAMIEDSFARGDHSYDLGPDYLASKRYWQTEVRTAYRYTHFAAGAPLGQLARAKRGLKRWWGARAEARADRFLTMAPGKSTTN